MIKVSALLTLLICFFSHSANSKIGVAKDSKRLQTATLQCFVSQGITNFGYFTGFPSQYTINQDLFQIKNAGMSVDIIYIPCQTRNPTQEVKQFLKGVLPGLIDRIWLDNIKQVKPCSWPYDNPARNVQLLTEYANLFTFSKYKTGIVAYQDYWQKITLNTSLLNNFPLFWLENDNKPSFNDYIPFGGWKKPTVKVFTQTQICGIDVALYYEQ